MKRKFLLYSICFVSTLVLTSVISDLGGLSFFGYQETFANNQNTTTLSLQNAESNLEQKKTQLNTAKEALDKAKNDKNNSEINSATEKFNKAREELLEANIQVEQAKKSAASAKLNGSNISAEDKAAAENEIAAAEQNIKRLETSKNNLAKAKAALTGAKSDTEKEAALTAIEKAYNSVANRIANFTEEQDKNYKETIDNSLKSLGDKPEYSSATVVRSYSDRKGRFTVIEAKKTDNTTDTWVVYQANLDYYSTNALKGRNNGNAVLFKPDPNIDLKCSNVVGKEYSDQSKVDATNQIASIKLDLKATGEMNLKGFKDHSQLSNDALKKFEMKLDLKFDVTDIMKSLTSENLNENTLLDLYATFETKAKDEIEKSKDKLEKEIQTKILNKTEQNELTIAEIIRNKIHVNKTAQNKADNIQLHVKGKIEATLGVTIPNHEPISITYSQEFEFVIDFNQIMADYNHDDKNDQENLLKQVENRLQDIQTNIQKDIQDIQNKLQDQITTGRLLSGQ